VHLDRFSARKDQQLAVGPEARADPPGELSKNALGPVPLNGAAQPLPHDDPDAWGEAPRVTEYQVEQRSLYAAADSFDVFDVGT